jgi:hypothetical protein
MELEQRQYPIGKWKPKKKYSEKEIQKSIQFIEKYPSKLKRLTKNLSETDLSKSYRDGGWTIRQLVHHLADTHIFHIVRFKHALTEENPVGVIGKINDWAELKDYTAPINDSLILLDGTHRRLAFLAKNLTEADLERTYYHSFRQLNVTLAQGLHMVVWHAKHHFEHIKIALNN